MVANKVSYVMWGSAGIPTAALCCNTSNSSLTVWRKKSKSYRQRFR